MVKFSIYLNRRVFVMLISIAVFLSLFFFVLLLHVLPMVLIDSVIGFGNYISKQYNWQKKKRNFCQFYLNTYCFLRVTFQFKNYRLTYLFN